MRRSRVRPVNLARARRKYDRNFGDKADWIRSMDCLRCGFPPYDHAIQAAHVKCRQMGGCGGDKRHLVPLCDVRGCHSLLDRLGVECFLEVTGVDVSAEAERLEEEWCRQS